MCISTGLMKRVLSCSEIGARFLPQVWPRLDITSEASSGVLWLWRVLKEFRASSRLQMPIKRRRACAYWNMLAVAQLSGDKLFVLCPEVQPKTSLLESIWILVESAYLQRSIRFSQ